jgi:single-stranded DNA-binding protein
MSNSSGVNRIFLAGQVETTPKKHTSSNGTDARVHFVLSTKESIKKGEQIVEHFEMHHLFINSSHADLQHIDLCRGAFIHVAGKIQTRTITDGDGVRQYKTEIMVQQLTLLQVPVEVNV